MNILFPPVELRVQSALRVRDGRHIEHVRLPFEPSSPNEPFDLHIEVRARIR